MAVTKTSVLIVGGGPAGLVLSIELGRRDIPCIVLDRGTGEPDFPKANSTTSRTMEHYRRLGMSEEIRRIGLPDDYHPDISYHTRYGAYELARLHWPSRTEALGDRHRSASKWPTPEPMHRGQQMFIEPILKAHASRLASVDLRFGWAGLSAADLGDRIRVEAEDLATGEGHTIEAEYVIGCEGPRSVVRQAMDVKYEGIAGENRDFLGGRMMATFLHAPAFYTEGPQQESWQYWCINPEKRGIMMAIDGKGLFAFHTQLEKNQEPSIELAQASFDKLFGRSIPYEIKGVASWTAGFTLVVEKMCSGRMFLAGDAAHLFTPTAGLGYNTSVDDVANLGWKLAASLKGWGGPALLSSYDGERRPIAQRNTAFARSLADFFRKLDLDPLIEQSGSAGDEARTVLGARLHEFAEREFAAPGIILGVFYGDSPVIATEDGAPPADHPNDYLPHGRPGARAPHVWLAEGVALFDRFGPEFTLVRFDTSADTSAAEKSARDLGVPLTVIDVDSPAARDLYGAALVLIRPDHHIAWRGTTMAPDEAARVFRLVAGRSSARTEAVARREQVAS